MGFGGPIDSLPWTQVAPGLREKVLECGEYRFRLIEFTDSFREHDWCTRKHSGYVLAGEIIISIDGRLIRFQAGDVINLPAGTPHRHDKTVSVATLFLVEDLNASS